VKVVGYVDDLDELLATSSVLLAPVSIGGGVRVKVLDAARHGLPVVGTPQAIGSISEYLPVEPSASASEFSARAVALLSSQQRAREVGERLYEANRELWHSGFVHRQVQEWIAGS
jgi:glycosyltransferase involved in cell wall biosynthesis